MKKTLLALLLLAGLVFQANAQQYPCPFVNAGPDKALPCGANCTNVSATFLQSNYTGSYRIDSIGYTPFAYLRGAIPPAPFYTTDDQYSAAINLPFTFCFFGVPYNQCVIGNNGMISFNVAQYAGQYNPWSLTAASNIPSPNQQLNSIMGPYMDIIPGQLPLADSNYVNYATFGTAPCRKFVVSYYQVPFYSSSTCPGQTLTSQIVLYETTNVIDIYIGSKTSCAAWNGGLAIEGIQNATGTAGYAVPGRNRTVWTATNDGRRFVPTGPSNVTIDWYQGGTHIASTDTVLVCPPNNRSTPYVATATYHNCDSALTVVRDTVYVNVLQSAGPTQYLSCPSPTASVTMNASGTGTWTAVPGNPSAVNIVSPTSPNTVISSFTAAGTYQFQWSAGLCTDTCRVIVTARPDAGPDQNRCKRDTVTMNAYGTGTWSALPTNPAATTIFVPTANNTRIVGFTAGGAYGFVWTTSAGCSDTMYVNIPNFSIALSAGSNVVCQYSNTTVTVTPSVASLAPFQYTWLDSTIVQSPHSATTSVHGLPGNTYFHVQVTSNDGCKLTDSILITTTTAVGTNIRASVSPSTVCPGGAAQLVVVANPNSCGAATSLCSAPGTTVNIGTATTYQNGPTSQYPCIYGNYYKSAHHQFLIHASELIGQVPSGGQIKSVTFNVRTLNGAGPLTNFTISLGCVGNDSMNDAFLATGGLTQVYTNASYQPVQGLNTHVFQTAYNWDGFSNIVVDICFNNSTSGSINPKFFYTTTPFKSVWCTFDNTPGGMCNVIGTQHTALANSALFQRPNMQFNMCITDLTGANLQWTPSTGPNAPTPTNLDTVIAHPITSTQYQVALTSANGCVNYDFVTVNVDTTVQLTVKPDTFVCSVSPVNVNAQLRLASGASINPANVVYTWRTDPATSPAPPSGTGPSFASAVLTPTVTTTYICTISGPGFCTVTDSSTVTLGNGLPVNKIVDSITCAGSSTGKVFINMTSGTPPYRYTWSPAAPNTDSIVNLAAGTYYVTVTDTAGCIGKDTTRLIAPSPLTLAFDSANILCYNVNIDSIRARVSGGRTPYRYTWSPSANNTNVLSNLPAGNYLLTVTDTSGCQISGSVNITQPTQLVSSASSTNLTGAGTHNGTITVSTSGGTPAYTYTSNLPAPGLPNATGLDTGTYIITICDANHCCVNDTTHITAPPPVVITFAVTNNICKGQCNGTAAANVTGGVPPYTYAWAAIPSNTSHGTTDTITGLCAGSYRVTVTDHNGNTATKDTSISEPTAIGMKIDSTSITCYGAANGSLRDSVYGGTPPYSITWTPGGSNPLNNIGPGMYIVQVYDQYQCAATDTAYLSQPPQLTIDTVSTAGTKCFNSSDGKATVVAAGGTPPYRYTWSGSSSTTTTATDLSAGPQAVSVTDAHGCVASISFTITQPAQLLIANVNTTPSHCLESNDGAAGAHSTGGTAPYTYTWDGVAGADTINSLSPGTHAVKVTDANGCQASGTALIDTQYVLHVSTTVTDVHCHGGNDGSVTVTPLNGTGSYTYGWSPSSSVSATASGLIAGVQNVTVIDAYGCKATATATVNEPAPITDNIYFSDPLCASQPNGKVWLTAGGTTGPYTFTFNGGGTVHPITDTIFGLTSATYTLIITDGNGCTKTDNVTLTDPSQLNVPVPTVQGISCANDANGSIQVNPTGGTLPYTYMWSPGGFTTAQQSNLAPATYDITVTDANGCNVSVAVTLAAPPPISFTYIQSDSTSCPGSTDGHIVVNVTGGTPGNNVPYTYSIDGVHYYSNHNFYDLAAGSYHVFVTDSPGCTLDTVVRVYQPFPVTASINPQDSLIALGSSLQLFTVINNITTQTINSYSWTPALGLSCLDCPNPVASPYQSTQYFLTVNYGKNCTTTASNTIEVAHGPDTYIPNAFTPNGDGTNDVFEVFGTGLKSVGMKIFNRWGEKIFDSGDNQWASWDGTYMGTLQPTGVYIYYVELVYLDGQKKMREGSLTLIR